MCVLILFGRVSLVAAMFWVLVVVSLVSVGFSVAGFGALY